MCSNLDSCMNTMSDWSTDNGRCQPSPPVTLAHTMRWVSRWVVGCSVLPCSIFISLFHSTDVGRHPGRATHMFSLACFPTVGGPCLLLTSPGGCFPHQEKNRVKEMGSGSPTGGSPASESPIKIRRAISVVASHLWHRLFLLLPGCRSWRKGHRWVARRSPRRWGAHRPSRWPRAVRPSVRRPRSPGNSGLGVLRHLVFTPWCHCRRRW